MAKVAKPKKKTAANLCWGVKSESFQRVKIVKFLDKKVMSLTMSPSAGLYTGRAQIENFGPI